MKNLTFGGKLKLKNTIKTMKLNMI